MVVIEGSDSRPALDQHRGCFARRGGAQSQYALASEVPHVFRRVVHSERQSLQCGDQLGRRAQRRQRSDLEQGSYRRSGIGVESQQPLNDRKQACGLVWARGEAKGSAINIPKARITTRASAAPVETLAHPCAMLLNDLPPPAACRDRIRARARSSPTTSGDEYCASMNTADRPDVFDVILTKRDKRTSGVSLGVASGAYGGIVSFVGIEL